MQLTQTSSPILAVSASRQTVHGLLRVSRPKQWTKNVLVFGPLVFAHNLFDANLLSRAFLTFAAFCLVSSAIYVVNDVADVEHDRQHPTKRFRPLASGQLSISLGLAWAVVLAVGGIALGFAADPAAGLCALAYIALMLAYTNSLKNMVILDVFSIALGFILRAVAGALAIHVSISPWLYVCTMLLALFLGFSKRYNELLILDHDAAQHRPALEEYSPAMLEQMTTILSASTIMAYSLYTFSAESLPANHSMMLTVPFALYGIFRYYYLVHKKNLGGAPEIALLHDRPLLTTVALWGLVAIGVLYSA